MMIEGSGSGSRAGTGSGRLQKHVDPDPLPCFFLYLSFAINWNHNSSGTSLGKEVSQAIYSTVRIMDVNLSQSITIPIEITANARVKIHHFLQCRGSGMMKSGSYRPRVPCKPDQLKIDKF
jgi:hypothetical protein